MIRYTLKCNDNHAFESWFASSSAYDGLHAAGHVQCPECGSTKVEKALMAPAVRPKSATAAAPDTSPAATTDPVAAQHARAAALAELRKQVEANSEYVGVSFAAEARAMHNGDVPARQIHGEARLDEARKLLEDGVPVAPLPFIPTRQTN